MFVGMIRTYVCVCVSLLMSFLLKTCVLQESDIGNFFSDFLPLFKERVVCVFIYHLVHKIISQTKIIIMDA